MTKGTEDYQSSSKQLEKDLRYLANMYDAGIYIDRYANRLYDAEIYGGEDIEMIEDALNMKTQVFTENAVKISDQFQNDHFPNFPWFELRFMRNDISHTYENINKEMIRILAENINEILTFIEQVLEYYDYSI